MTARVPRESRVIIPARRATASSPHRGGFYAVTNSYPHPRLGHMVTASKLCFTIEVTTFSLAGSFLPFDVASAFSKLRNTTLDKRYHRTNCLYGIMEGTLAPAITIKDDFFQLQRLPNAFPRIS